MKVSGGRKEVKVKEKKDEKVIELKDEKIDK